MAGSDLISVIMPVYNREKYIRKGIESVLSQKNVNIEMILIDDGSSDDSPDIIREYEEKYSNVIAFYQKNQGVGVARNKGLELSHGEYIFFIDSDDYIAEDTLFKLLNCIKQTGADMCCCVYSRFYEDGTLEYEHNIKEQYRNRVLTEKEYLSLMLIENSYLWSSSIGKLFKKSVFEDIRYPVILRGEDEYIVPQLMKKVNGIYLLDEVLYYQVLSKVSIIRSKLSMTNLYTTYSMLHMLDYLISKEYFDLALFRFGVATRSLNKWKNETDDKEIKKAIKDQYFKYKSVAKELIPHVSKPEKIRLWLFCVDFNLYFFVRNLLRKT